MNDYLTGLFHLASSLSTNMGPSYINVDIFKKRIFEKEFKKHYKVIIKDELVEDNINLKDLLNYLFNDDKIEDSLLYWIYLYLDKEKKIYTLKENSKVLDNIKNSGFYTTEDVYFIEFNDNIVCLLLGNNE